MKADPSTPTAEFLKSQLSKVPDDSKKWRAARLGLQGVGGFFVVGAILFFIRPDLAANVTTLVQMAITAWGGIVAVYITGQASVDFKSTAALAAADEHVEVTRKTDRTEHVIIEGSPGAPETRPFSSYGEEN